MCKKLVESKVPSNIRVMVQHFHQGNSSRSMRKGHSYMTRCRLLDKENRIFIGEGVAYCSCNDTPNRHLGRNVAVGRAMKSAGLESVISE